MKIPKTRSPLGFWETAGAWPITTRSSRRFSSLLVCRFLSSGSVAALNSSETETEKVLGFRAFGFCVATRGAYRTRPLATQNGRLIDDSDQPSRLRTAFDFDANRRVRSCQPPCCQPPYGCQPKSRVGRNGDSSVPFREAAQANGGQCLISQQTDRDRLVCGARPVSRSFHAGGRVAAIRRRVVPNRLTMVSSSSDVQCSSRF